jgi:hypothetical protein
LKTVLAVPIGLAMADEHKFGHGSRVCGAVVAVRGR